MSGNPTPPASGGTEPEETTSTTPPLFTQEQVNSVAARERREAREKAIREIEEASGLTLAQIKALKAQEVTPPTPAPTTPPPATQAPVQPAADQPPAWFQPFAQTLQTVSQKLSSADEKIARDALEGKAKAQGVWEQFMPQLREEGDIAGLLEQQRGILEQHGAGAKKPAPTTNGGASTSVRDVATDEMTPEQAHAKLKEIGGI